MSISDLFGVSFIEISSVLVKKSFIFSNLFFLKSKENVHALRKKKTFLKTFILATLIEKKTNLILITS
jgi:hypothetical protein